MFDLVIVAFALAAAVGGYRLGFVTRVFSWAGLVVGIIGGAAVLPTVIDRLGDRLPRTDLIFVAAGVVIGGALVGQALGLLVGARAQIAVPAGRARRLDAVAGALAGVVGVAATVWLVAPAMADVPEWPARAARESSLVRAIDEVFPDAPDPSRTVRQVLGDRYPQVFDALRPAPDLGPPPASSGLDATVADGVTASTVLVTGEACGQIQEGSGFVVGDDLVATNAHVVAGQGATDVVTAVGERRRAELVAFDPDRDLAILRVEGLARPALPVGDTTVGGVGAVFGHPGGGPLRLAPFEVGERVMATGSDIYGRTGVDREVLVLSAALRPGDSGAALVAPDGTVVGVAFAIAPDRSGVAYALSTTELRSVLDTVGPAPVASGACLA